MQYAGFWLRVIAILIDGLILGVIGAVVGAVVGVPATPGFSAINVVLIAVNWLYFTLSESSEWQATIGKRALGLKVTDEHGNRIGFGVANIRYWSKILSCLILFLGFVMVAFTARKQGLHDLIAKTLVMRK